MKCANVRVHPTGSVTVFTGTHSHGQGHETTFAQLVADQLGVPIDQVEIVHGDTAKIPFGMGTYGSRSLAVGGSAMVKAMDKIIAKGKKIAAHLLEASVDDIEFKDGKFTVAGTDKAKTLAEISLAAYVPHNYPIEELEPGLDETAFYDPKNFTFPGGCHVAEVEIDPDTGVDRGGELRRGRRCRPGDQPDDRRGPGAGRRRPGHRPGAAGRRASTTATGQLLSGSLMDYTMPRADNLPNITVGTESHAVHAQPAGREGLRRGRRDRLAAGDHQRGGRCAEGLRRAAYRHAGERAEDSGRSSRPAARRWRRNRARGQTMYDFAYQKPASLADAAEGAGRRCRRQGAGRRHDADPGAEAAADQAHRSWSTWRSWAWPASPSPATRVTIGAMTTHAAVAGKRRCEGEDPGAGASRRA